MTRPVFLYALESHDGQKPLGYIFRKRTGEYGVQYLDYPPRKARTLAAATALAMKWMHADDRIVPMKEDE